MQQELGSARLFVISIGSAPNHFLATKMAQLGRGTFTHIADVDEVRSEMGRFFATLEHPVLTDVNVFLEGVEAAELYPQRAPDLFLHQPLLISGYIAKGRAGAVRVSARTGDDPYEAIIAFDASTATFHPGTTTLWARRRVEHLMDEWRRADEYKRADLRLGVIEHAVHYGLVTQFTSLVAVEDVIVNGSGRLTSAALPTELPAGWQMDEVFGPPATGTADAFLQALGLAVLGAGVVLLLVTRRARCRA
jgi:Ca-activated chloride channel family protein